MTHLVFVDTETTGLDVALHEPWEVAVIVRNHPNPSLDGEWCWLVPPRDLLAAGSDALRIGRYYTRAASKLREAGGVICTAAPGSAIRMDWARHGCAWMLAALTEGATFIANNAAFDARFIEQLLRRECLVPAWDYRVIDVVAMAAAQQRLPLPWRSEQLSEQCGVPLPAQEERHSALGDARWVERWWDHLTSTPDVPTSTTPDTTQEA